MSGGQAFDITSLHAFYRGGGTTAEIIDQVFARIDAVDDPGIFLHIADRQALLSEATTLGTFDPVGKPLWGIPFAVKDNIDVAACRPRPPAPTTPIWQKTMRPSCDCCEKPARW
jgi:allophanate hydrolase